MLRFLRIVKEKITPIDLNDPDAVVVVTNTRHSKNPFGKDYRGCCAIQENYLTSLCFQTLDGNDMLYKQPHRCFVNFLTPTLYPYTLWIGRRIDLYEGKYHVGTMVVEEIRNPVLDRNAKFEDQKDILKNYKVLNLALKRSLEWGKKFIVPLDNKLMSSAPELSGSDIEKVSQYIIQVRDDILWKIYYPNRDVKAEAFKNDAKIITAEKYPWMDKDNPASLDSQGKYYARHG